MGHRQDASFETNSPCDSIFVMIQQCYFNATHHVTRSQGGASIAHLRRLPVFNDRKTVSSCTLLRQITEMLYRAVTASSEALAKLSENPILRTGHTDA